MKKILLSMLIIVSLNTFAKLNDGKYEVVHKKDNNMLMLKVIIKNNKIIFVDYDKIDENGVKFSTINATFRNEKEELKKIVIENQSLEDIESKNKEFKKLIEFLIEKNNSSKQGNYEI